MGGGGHPNILWNFLLRVKFVISMKTRFTNQTVDVELPNTQGQAKVTV